MDAAFLHWWKNTERERAVQSESEREVDAARGHVLATMVIIKGENRRESVDLFTDAQWARFKLDNDAHRPIPFRLDGVDYAIEWSALLCKAVYDPVAIVLAQRQPGMITNRIVDALPPGYGDAEPKAEKRD